MTQPESARRELWRNAMTLRRFAAYCSPVPEKPSASEVTESVSDVVRLLKQLSHVTDRQIADAIGLSRNVAQQRVSGLSRWSTGELFLLAEFFGVPLSLFFMDAKEAAVAAIRDYEVQNLRYRLDGR